ncbi:MAG: hypothetical protein ACPGF7_07750 [Pontibacterium sp.]
MRLVLSDINREVDRCSTGMVDKLTYEEQQFVPSLVKDLLESVAQLKRDLEDREQSLQTYQDIVQQADVDLATIQ